MRPVLIGLAVVAVCVLLLVSYLYHPAPVPSPVASTSRLPRTKVDAMLVGCSELTDPYEQHICEEGIDARVNAWQQDQVDLFAEDINYESGREDPDDDPGYGPHEGGT